MIMNYLKNPDSLRFVKKLIVTLLSSHDLTRYEENFRPSRMSGVVRPNERRASPRLHETSSNESRPMDYNIHPALTKASNWLKKCHKENLNLVNLLIIWSDLQNKHWLKLQDVFQSKIMNIID